MDLSVTLRLSLMDVSAGGINVKLRRKKPSEPAGPFLIIARDCGLALDTALRNTSGEPHLWPPHGLPHQLWTLQPSGTAEQVFIVSATNGHVLDSGPDLSAPALWMWDDRHGMPWQRWQLEKTPDGVGCLIRACHSNRYLTASDERVRGSKPRFEDRDSTKLAQQWLLTQPHSYAAK